MKIYLISFIIILGFGCFAPKKAVVRMLNDPAANGGPVLSQERRGRVRTPEVVKAYPVGRYVDTISGRVMHEKHTMYRVEGDANWNLRGEVIGAPVETLPKIPEVNRGHLSALAEQNAVLEKKIRILEQDHARCSEPRSLMPRLEEPQAPVSSELSVRNGNRIPFRKESFLFSKGSKSSLSSVE